MKTDDRKWIVVRIDGKIAGISTDYRILASISELLAQSSVQKKEDKAKERTGRKRKPDTSYYVP